MARFMRHLLAALFFIMAGFAAEEEVVDFDLGAAEPAAAAPAESLNAKNIYHVHRSVGIVLVLVILSMTVVLSKKSKE